MFFILFYFIFFFLIFIFFLVGICISDNALKDPCSEGDQQYQCTSAKNMGEINIFDTCDPNDKEGGKDKYCSVSAMETKWYYMTVVSVVVKR